jgi:hypothetical protein
LPPLAPQVSQVGNTALIKLKAVTLPLDHAIGFELPDVGPAAIKMLRQREGARPFPQPKPGEFPRLTQIKPLAA